MAATLWFIDNGELISQKLSALGWLDADARLLAERRPNAIPLAPVSHSHDAIAVLLIPDEQRGQVALNGVVADAELLPLKHSDCFELRGTSFWIAAEFTAEETEYSAARHDNEARCFITKARLRDGEPITICPGQPGNSCGMIYKRSAWRVALSGAAKFRCPNCSFDPRMPVWRPSPPLAATSLDPILRLLLGERPQ